MKSTKLIATLIVLAITATPALSFARASGGGGRGAGGGISKGSSPPSSVGSRGSRTYDNTGNKPIERSTTPQPAPNAAPPPTRPAVQPQPPAQPAFWQRHPILTGLAAGIAGSWIGHMLFGASNTMAAEGEGAADNGGSLIMLLLLMVLGAGVLYYFMKVRRSQGAAHAYSGASSSSVRESELETLPASQGFMSQPQATGGGLLSGAPTSVEDEAKFKQILIDVQAAWSRQDLDGLKRVTTPEMLHYFSTALSENVSTEVENRVEDLRVLSAELRESWTEESTDYATVLLSWTARDYTISLQKKRGEPGYMIEGSDQMPTEVSEAWTFMRYRGGKWLLSAIQQTE